MSNRELKKIYGSKWANDQKTISRRERRKERQKKLRDRRKTKNAIKDGFSDGLGILQVVMLIILIITIARILSGTIEGNYPFSQFFNELISFEGINIKSFLDGANTGILDNIELPSWLDWLNTTNGFLDKVFQPIVLIFACLINACWFILHVLGVLFGF